MKYGNIVDRFWILDFIFHTAHIHTYHHQCICLLSHLMLVDRCTSTYLLYYMGSLNWKLHCYCATDLNLLGTTTRERDRNVACCLVGFVVLPFCICLARPYFLFGTTPNLFTHTHIHSLHSHKHCRKPCLIMCSMQLLVPFDWKIHWIQLEVEKHGNMFKPT